MNKDVIYVEPEDDITDIILKIEKSKEKIIALVPPKKAGVFRSVVNIKLIAKSGATSGKKIVLVTVDPSIIRLAASAKIPVTKDLQTVPTIPEPESETNVVVGESIVEDEDGNVSSEESDELEDDDDEKEDKTDKEAKTAKSKKSEQLDGEDDEESDDDKDDEDDEDDTDTKKHGKKDDDKKRGKNAKKSTSNGFVGWIKDHKKLTIAGSIGIVLLIVGLVWALTIAPAVDVLVGVRTTSNSFSESISFVDSVSEEKVDEGKFHLDEKKIETIKEVEFEATGKKNIGEKATGDVVVYAYFPLNIKSSVQINAGDNFTISGLTFKATKSTTLTYSGEGKSECANKDNSEGLVDYGCRVNGVVPVEAAEAGSQYNIAASSTGWDTNARVFAYSEKAMQGGSDKEIVIVLQSDVDKAKESLATSDEKENKEKLLSGIPDGSLIIDSSFSQTTAEAISTPNVGEEVKEGEKPKLKAVTTTSIDVIDRTKVEEFITKKANIAENQKIYSIKDPFIEGFTKTSSGFVGKLKTSYLTGPKLSVSSIVDTIRGKGIGDAQHTLKDISGVTDVQIKTSFPWVMSVPNDTNKITVNLEFKDQDGNKVDAPADNDESKQDKSEEKSDQKDNEEKKAEENK